MGKTLVSPFEGFPTTNDNYDDDNKLLNAEVSVNALSPFSKFCVDKLRWVIGVGSAVSAAAAIYQLREPATWVWALTPVTFFASVALAHLGLSEALKSKRKFRITRETFERKNWYGRWVVYDRHQPHRFTLKEHRWAKTEARIIEYFKARAANKGRATLMRPYFGESFHLCFEFGRRPIRLMSIHGQTKPQLALGRLTALDEALDGTLAGRSGMVLKPKDEWDRSVGSLQETF